MALNIRLRVKTTMAKKMTLAMNQPPLTCRIETGRVNEDTDTGRDDTGRDKDRERGRNKRGDDKDREKWKDDREGDEDRVREREDRRRVNEDRKGETIWGGILKTGRKGEMTRGGEMKMQ